MEKHKILLPSVEEAGIVAVELSENIDPKLTSTEQAFFIAGFQECIKWLNRYTKKVIEQDLDCDIYTVEEWNIAVKEGLFCSYDGNGYWVKDGFRSDDEVFSTPKLDATHVIWYNK